MRLRSGRALRKRGRGLGKTGRRYGGCARTAPDGVIRGWRSLNPAGSESGFSSRRSVDLEGACRVAVYGDAHRHRVVGQQLFDLLGPLHQTQVSRVEILLVTEVEGFPQVVDAVEIEVVDASVALALVLVDDGERGAGHGVGGPEFCGDFTDERGFARAHLAAEGDHRTAAQRADDRPGDLRKLVLRGDVNGFHLLFWL